MIINSVYYISHLDPKKTFGSIHVPRCLTDDVTLDITTFVMNMKPIGSCETLYKHEYTGSH